MARIALWSCVQLVIVTPLNAVTVSPTFSPARTAGDFGASAGHASPFSRAAFEGWTQGVTAATWFVVTSFSTPMPSASPKMSTAASTKCMNDPAPSTISFCQPGARRNERGSSSSSTSSTDVMPVILTKPPSGSALMPYSVSPR